MNRVGHEQRCSFLQAPRPALIVQAFEDARVETSVLVLALSDPLGEVSL